tara:strand:+ start:256 stop:1380 length:1125 start_codon:yes stop_codon:yes gene_type:complete
MKMTKYYFLWLLCTGLIFLSACKKDNTPDPIVFKSLEEEIIYITEPYIRTGAIVGIINKNQERQVFSFGTKAVTTSQLPDINTVFEIGSMTKTFTATLLAKLMLEGVLEDDTVEHYLPVDSVFLPYAGGEKIRFIHLATHTSGIPRTLQDSDYPKPHGYNIFDPYAEYTTEIVYDYLTNFCELEFTPGSSWSYSNTGMGLLGHIIGLIDNTSFETVLQQQIFDELDMDRSSVLLNDEQKINLVLGYNSSNQLMPEFTAQDILQGAGFIKSSLNDMFIYLEANMGLIETGLYDAMLLAHQPTPYVCFLGLQGMAWYTLELEDGQVITYTGGNTAGQASLMAFNKSTLTGMILLFNSSSNYNIYMGHEIMKAIAKY